MWLWVAGTTASVILAIRIYYRLKSGRCNSKVKLHGKTAIVTGASAGIGKETARDLAARGARVILACRNLDKAQNVADDIIASTINDQVLVKELDLSSFRSVRKFANEILNTEKALHILINNAGIVGPSAKELTEDGLEVTMATNHLGHFLLTNILLGLMKASGPSRIINVSSGAHNMCKEFDAEDLNYEKGTLPMGMMRYSQSKLANILFTKEMAEKLRGTGVTVNSLNPGAVDTEILVKNDSNWLGVVFKTLISMVAKDEKLGAQTTIYLAVSEEIENITGEYFSDCKISKKSELAKDPDLARKLWEVSERMVHLAPEERHY